MSIDDQCLLRKGLVKKTCLMLMLVAILGRCKISDTSGGELSSFRSENGERTVAVGFYLNDYPTVTDGAFFPFELFHYTDEEFEEIGDSFKGYSGDVMTGKDPFGGFISEQAITEAKERKLKDPYHFAGYFLKIMVVHGNIEQLPVEVDLYRGFFPPDFVCPKGAETIKIKGEDRALGYPGGGKSLSGDDSYINRTNRQITFCRVNEVNGPYAGQPLYYTRVELFDKSEDHIDELYDDSQSYQDSPLIKKLPGVHQELAVAVRFKYKEQVDGRVDFNVDNTVVGLDYNVVPRLNEMLELLQQNSTDHYQGIVESTDMVQEYLYHNRDRAEDDGEWQLLKVAQRKWLAIRMVLLLMGQNINKKAEELRQQILESLELANLHELYPLAKKITSYASASDYITDMTNNPEGSVSEGEDWFKGNSHQQFNKMIYQLAIEAGLRQWYFSKRVYGEILEKIGYDRHIAEYLNGQDTVPLCGNHCSQSDRDFIINKKNEFKKAYSGLKAIGEQQLHNLFMRYVIAINAVHPDPHKNATAEFKLAANLQLRKLDYAKSSDTYKSLYESYARRYDLVFSEPHGLLLGANAVQSQVQAKRQPDDVLIIDKAHGGYDWKKHPFVDIITLSKGVKQMLDGIYEAIEELTKIKSRIDTIPAQQQVKITSDLADQFHVAPIAQALLIRPDYTYLMKDILRKYSRVRATTVARHVVYGIAIAASIAGGALLVASFASLAAAGTAGAVFAGATVADLLSVSINFAQARGLRHRIERALFADSLGTNIDVYHQSRQQYYKIQRDLYWSAGFAAIDMAGFVSTGFKYLRTRRQLNELRNVWKKLELPEYENVAQHLKRCSTVYCRRLLRFSPILAGDDANELAKMFEDLNSIKFKKVGRGSIDEFKEKIENIWLAKKELRSLAISEFAGDAMQTAMIPLTNVRIAGSHSNFLRRRGLNSIRKIKLDLLTDSQYLDNLVIDSKKLTKANFATDRVDEVLNTMEVLAHGRQKKRRFLFFPRKQESILQGQLAMNDSELRELFGLATDGGSTEMVRLNGELINLYEGAKNNFKKLGLSRAQRKKARKIYKGKIEEIKEGKFDEAFTNEAMLKEAVKLGENRERTKILKNTFDDLIGGVAKFNKESKKLEIKEEFIEKMFNTRKWKKIGERMNKEAAGSFEELKKEARDSMENLVDNLNKMGIESLAAYNRRMIKINN